MGQSPVAEFGAHQRFVPGLHRFAPGSEKPAARPASCRTKRSQLRRLSGLEMVVRNVSLDVRARRQWRIVYHEPPRVIGFQPPVSLFEPGPVIRVMNQVHPPVLVDNRPADDRWVIAVAVDDTLQSGPFAGPRTLG